MGLPMKGVVLPLEPFVVVVKREAYLRSLTTFSQHPTQALRYQQRLDRYVYHLIMRLLEQMFLIQVVPGEQSQQLFASEKYQWTAREFDAMIAEAINEYELLFSECLDRVIRMHDFPDIVYLDKLGDTVIVTWKQQKNE